MNYMNMQKSFLLLLFWIGFVAAEAQHVQVAVGAQSTTEYLPLLEGKRVAVFANHTSQIDSVHIVDAFLRKGINVRMIFAPEHGFRGVADAGESINDSRDKETGLPIISLYKSRTGKPTTAQMNQFDVLVFDIQDVGLRFYTYYISMYKLMDACAEHQKEMIILDRPNPNGFYMDGPILDMKYKSGVGYLPIPVVHGMTLGELARMINGEGWLPGKRRCPLTVIPCQNYSHHTKYTLPVPPSPNLPNMQSIYLYPSVCLFEGTNISLGRGTDFPFQVYGSPTLKGYSFHFTPRSVPGAQNPPFLNKKCYGADLREVPHEDIWKAGFDLTYVIDAYRRTADKSKFFTPFFLNLTGVDYIRRMIIEGKENEEIRAVWQSDLEEFARKRKPYLLYDE